jgi:hypothetical protein
MVGHLLLVGVSGPRRLLAAFAAPLARGRDGVPRYSTVRGVLRLALPVTQRHVAEVRDRPDRSGVEVVGLGAREVAAERRRPLARARSTDDSPVERFSDEHGVEAVGVVDTREFDHVAELFVVEVV